MGGGYFPAVFGKDIGVIPQPHGFDIPRYSVMFIVKDTGLFRPVGKNPAPTILFKVGIQIAQPPGALQFLSDGGTIKVAQVGTFARCHLYLQHLRVIRGGYHVNFDTGVFGLEGRYHVFVIRFPLTLTYVLDHPGDLDDLVFRPCGGDRCQRHQQGD